MTKRTPAQLPARAEERFAPIDDTLEVDVEDAVADDSDAAHDFDDFDGLEVEDRTLQRVDSIELRSLALVAGLFYLTAFLVLGCAVAIVWIFAASTGFISQLEEFMQDIGFRDFRLVAPEVILGFLILILALVLFLTVMTVLAGAFYNILGVGNRGIRIRTTILERERRVCEPEDEEPETLVTKPLVVEPPTSDGNGDGTSDGDGAPEGDGESDGDGVAKATAEDADADTATESDER